MIEGGGVKKQHQDITALGELLKVDYRLDPGSFQLLLEQALEFGDSAVAAMVWEVLSNSQLNSDQLDNVAKFVSLASERSSICRLLDHSARSKGRCPKHRRLWLQSVLHKRYDGKCSDSTAQAIRPRNLLSLDDLNCTITDIPVLLSRLAVLDPSAGRVQIRLGGFTYASALAILAQWLLANGLEDSYEFVETPPEMHDYLDRMHFGRAMRNREVRVSPDPMDWAVSLTRINRDQATELVTKKIVNILTTFISQKKDDAEALRVLIAEMIENVHKHALIKVDGFAVAQVYPRRLKMGITLVDAGIGIRGSFESGDPSIPIANLVGDDSFLKHAVQLHSTSKKTAHAGYGLYLLKELITRNRGTFLLSSGRATIVGWRKGSDVYLSTYGHETWNGTIVSVIVDLQRDLPLSDIYREMAPPRGYENDELFA